MSWFAPVLTLLNLVRLLQRPVRAKRIRARSQAIGFPLDQRMAILLTDQKIMVWRVRRLQRLRPTLLGTVPRDAIASAHLPYIGGSWRTVELRLADGTGVRFLVEPTKAQEFADALSGT